ncbi:MAG: DUF1553 domain-containing protein [Verrucomicrobiia bacterium]|jgi:mono/diheme cytochrome c family protein
MNLSLTQQSIRLSIGLFVLGMGELVTSAASSATVDFNRDVRPILSDNCFACHGPDQNARKAGLRFDTRDGLFASLKDGRKLIAPGSPARSELLAKLLHKDLDERMPPLETNKELSPKQIATVRAWIEQGAPWQGHWAFIPPQRANPPKTKNVDWPRNAIDQFILARLEQENLSPAPEADARTLIRRLHFDLTGLPPSPEAVETFVADMSQEDHSDAYEQAVDKLLKSERFGERMAVHWLDLVRYADTVGYHGDQEMNISPYRDYVINAFNSNLPFDQFTIEQLAGDLLPDATMWQKVASGYNRLNMTTEEGGAQPGEYLIKYAADRVRSTATVWLAATMGCAECHDHKFDPYTQKDFYRFAAFFADIEEVGKYTGRMGRPPEMVVPTPQAAKQLENLESRIPDLSKRVATLKKRVLGASRNDEVKLALRIKPEKRNKEDQRLVTEFYTKHMPELGRTQRELDRCLNEKKALEARARKTLISVSVKPRDTRVLHRGEWMDKSGEIVQPGPPAFLPQPRSDETRLTRLDLARWFVSRENPQTSRAFVNRLWKLFHGNGLSKILDDIGSQGEWPTHPELLDWLAVEFMESDWDMKRMVKLMVMSSTYRQSSAAAADLRERDPDNRLYARQSRWRLEAEFIRDNALAISDLLVNKIGGLSAKPYQPAGYYKHLNFPTRKYNSDKNENQYRRGVYTHWQRTFLHPSMLAFDAPSREECVAQRSISNTPSAALALLNDPSYVEAARTLAQNILTQGGDNDEARVRWAFRQSLSREPNADESAVLRELLKSHRAEFKSQQGDAQAALSIGLSKRPAKADPAELAAWLSVARTLLNLNETITRN